MDKAVDLLKQFIIKFLNLLVVGLILFIGFVTICANGVFISNVANAFRMTGYLDYSIGIQIVLVLISLVWIPIFLIRRLSTR